MEGITGRKILLVITKSNWGGAQQYVYTLATRFTEAGAIVAVALGGTGHVGAPAGLLAQRLADAGVGTIFLTSFARDVSFVREMKAFFELLLVIRREKPDVLHLNSSKAGGLGALAGRLAGVPRIIFTAHGWAHHESRPLYQRWSIWIASWLTAQLAHQVITLSNYHLQHAPVLFSRRKMSVIYNGLNTFPLLPRADARAAVAVRAPDAFRLPFWFFSLSELHPNKGLDTLIRAFKPIANTHAEAAFILIGDGQSRATLEAFVRSLGLSGRVFFIGFVENARELLEAADVFVLPSRKEGLPFVILEAAVARLPVIATRVGALPEIIDDGNSGLLVSPNDVFALTDALSQMIENGAGRERMALALHARIVRDFSEEEMFAKTAEAYRLF